jgi:hypothetical protein
VEPNLARIPADEDADAKTILDLARDGLTADLLGCMTGSDARALGSRVSGDPISDPQLKVVGPFRLLLQDDRVMLPPVWRPVLGR